MLLLNENESVACAPRIHSQAAFVNSAVSETEKLLDIDTAIATTAASISPITCLIVVGYKVHARYLHFENKL